MILSRLFASEAQRMDIIKCEDISATSNVRFDHNGTDNYLVKDCCFNFLTSETSYGGAISIQNGMSNMSIDSSSFAKCSSLNGGAIYSSCLNSQVNRCQAEDCSITKPKFHGSFLFQQSQQFSSDEISVHDCPQLQKESGDGSILLQSSTGDANLSNLNSTHNFNANGLGCSLSVEYFSTFTLHFALISNCESNEGKSIVYVLLTEVSELETTSFINNSLSYQVVYTYKSKLVDFYLCVFANNIKNRTFQIDTGGNIRLRKCFMDEKEDLNGNISISNLKWTKHNAFPLSMISLLPCTRVVVTTTEVNNLSRGAIAGIVIGSSLVALSVVGYVSYRLYSKNSAAAVRLRNFEMVESLVSEFG